MSAAPPSTHRRGIARASTIVLAPAILLFAILFPFASPLPISDDYDAALGYLNHMVQLPRPSARLFYLVTAQHNEYKLWFVNTLLWLQYRCFGPLDLRLAALCSNLLLLPVCFILWRLFLPALADTRTRLMLFVPVACLWFQLNYVETVDWAVSAYQTLPILIAALLGIYLLTRPGNRAFAASLLCIPAAIGSSGNGFLFVAVGALFLLRRRRFAALILWCLVAAFFTAIYAYGYTRVHEPSPFAQPLLQRILARPAFLFIWLGSAAAFRVACPLLGLALFAYWLAPARRRYLRAHPAIAYILLFILLTGCMITAGRAGTGIWSAQTSRYRLYSDLLLIFTWFPFAERLVHLRPRAPLRSRTYLVAMVASITFALGMDTYGFLYLKARTTLYTNAMAKYQHTPPGASPANPVPIVPLSPAHNEWERRTAATLKESERHNVYQPPRL